MGFSFLHCADLHLGRAFLTTIGEPAAAVLRQARFDVLDRLADLARAEGLRHVLVAGDVFNDQNLKRDTIRMAISHMSGHEHVQWHLLPGNHDYVQPGGIWAAFAAELGDAANILVHDTQNIVELEPGVQMLTCPCRTKFPMDDPTAWLDEAPRTAGAIRIGLAHGATIDFDRDDATRAVIDPQRAKRAELDYLALGDWHGAGEAGPRVWYSGSPEQDNWKNNDAGQALVVTIDMPGAEPRIVPHRVGQFRWRKSLLNISDTDVRDALSSVFEAGDHKPRLLLNLTLTGALTMSARAELETALERLGDDLRYLRVDDNGLVPIAGDDAGAFGSDGILGSDEVLAEAARRLMEQSDGDDDAARIARGALQRLHTLALQTGVTS